MIKVNLLPPEIGKRPSAAAAKARSGPTVAPYFAGLILLYGAALYGAFWAYQTGETAKEEFRKATSERDKKKAEVQRREQEFEANNLLSQEIEEKYAVVQALGPENRIYWSEKINMIARARMNLAVYITKLDLTEKIEELETEESIRRRKAWEEQPAPKGKQKGTPPAAIKTPVINQTLTIEAIAYGTDSSQRLMQIRSFYENLRAFEWKRKSGEVARFMDKIQPDFEALPQKMDRVAGVDVMRFGFKIFALPLRDRTKDSPSTGTVERKQVAAAGGGVSK